LHGPFEVCFVKRGIDIELSSQSQVAALILFGQIDEDHYKLEKAIAEFLAAWNRDPKPFVWTATVESIVEKLSRCKQTLERIKPGCTRPRTRKNKEK
jgi:hypothetical protein